jgi:glycosyltransferase involved in cell wall biosynthesis
MSNFGRPKTDPEFEDHPAPVAEADRRVAIGALYAEPLVSIVISCYNSERYVAEAVESALGQTYRHMEVVVVDDASTDGTMEVLERFGSRIQLERRSTNSGPGATRNHGLDLARGDYVQFLDADDVLLPDKVEACLSEFGSAVDMVFSDNAYFLDSPADARKWADAHASARLKKLFQWRPMQWNPDRAAEYMLRREVQTSMPLHRAALLRRIGGFREDLWSLEDIELHFRLAIRGARMRRIERVLVHCRHHDHPDRLRIQPGRFLVSLDALDAMHRRLTRSALDDGVRAALADRYANVGRRLLWEGHGVEAGQAFATARTLSRFPRTTALPLYNWVSRLVGLERLERFRMALWKHVGRKASTRRLRGGRARGKARAPANTLPRQ